MRVLSVVCAAWLAVMILPTPAIAAAASQRIAFFAAWSIYQPQESGFADLPENRRDVQAMYELAKSFGYQAEKPLVDVPQRQFLDALAAFGAKARSLPVGSQALIYISAHGFGFRGENWIVPSDAGRFDEDTLSHRTVPLARLIDALGDADEVARLIVVDMCRDEVLGKGAPAFLRSKNATPTAPVRREGVLAAPDGTLVLYATGPNTSARAAPAGERYSLFTGTLMEVLRQSPGAAVQDVMRETSRLVRQASGNTQRPTTEGAAGSIVINPGPVPPGPAEREALAKAEAARAEVEAERAKNAVLQAKITALTQAASEAPPRSSEPPKRGPAAQQPAVDQKARWQADIEARQQGLESAISASLGIGPPDGANGEPVPSDRPQGDAQVEFYAGVRRMALGDLLGADRLFDLWLSDHPGHMMADVVRQRRQEISVTKGRVESAVTRQLINGGALPQEAYAQVFLVDKAIGLAKAGKGDEACKLLGHARDGFPGISSVATRQAARSWDEELCGIQPALRYRVAAKLRLAALSRHKEMKELKREFDSPYYGRIKFYRDEKALFSLDKDKLDNLAAFLLIDPSVAVSVRSYSIDEPTSLALVGPRAELVRSYLIGRGIADERIEVVLIGATDALPGDHFSDKFTGATVMTLLD